MIIRATEFSDSVVFDISDMREKISVFAHQCPVASETITQASSTDENRNITAPNSENVQSTVDDEAKILGAYDKASKLYTNRECGEMNKVIASTLDQYDQYNGQPYLKSIRQNFVFLQDNCS